MRSTHESGTISANQPGCCVRSKSLLLVAMSMALLLQSLKPAIGQDLLFDALWDSANKAFAARDYKTAEMQLTGAIKALDNKGRRSDAGKARMTVRKLAEVYEAQAHYDYAEAILAKLVKLDEKDDVAKTELAADLDALGIVRRHLGKHAEAIAQFEHAISLLKSSHANTQSVEMNLAAVLQEQGKYEQCEELLKGVIERGTADGARAAMRQLAQMYTVQHRTAEAEALLKRVAVQSEARSQSETFASLIELGKSYVEQGKFDEAKAEFNRAIALAGSDTKEAGDAIIELGDAYLAQDKPNDATSMYEKARAIFEPQPGKNSSQFALATGKLADAALAVDKYDQAERFCKEQLQICDTIYGAHSRDSATARNRLGSVYLSQGKYAEAETQYKTALEDMCRETGTEHPDVATCMSNLAWCYRSEQRLDEAESLLKQALAIRQKTFGNDHPATARSLANLAEIAMARKDLNESERLLKQAIAIEEHALEPTHPDLGANLRALAYVQELRQSWAHAESTYRKLLEYDAKAGVSEATVAVDLDAAVRTLIAQSKEEEAQRLRAKSLAIKSKLPGLVNFAQPIVTTGTAGGANQPTAHCSVKDKWALVIGISNFQDPSLNLKYAAKDATDFRNYLIKEAHFQSDHVKLLTDKQATRQAIVENLGDKWLKRLANPDDLVVIYISTHGSSAKQEAGSANFIIPHDGNLDNMVFNGIPMQWLTAGIKDLVHCNRVVLVMDVCHGGAIADGAKGIRRSEIELDPQKLVTGEGQIVVASSQADQISWESKQYPNGVFTHRLLEGLRKNGDKTTLKDAYSYMRERVTEEVLRDRAHFQTPVLVTRWWQGDDIAIGVQPTQPRPGLASALPVQSSGHGVPTVSKPKTRSSKQ